MLHDWRNFIPRMIKVLCLASRLAKLHAKHYNNGIFLIYLQLQLRRHFIRQQEVPVDENVKRIVVRVLVNIMSATKAVTNCIPAIAVNDAKKMIEFYKIAFDATVVNMLIDPENGTVGHSEIMIHGGMIHLSEESKQYNTAPKSIDGATTVKIMVYVDDVDNAFTKAINAGAVEVRSPKTEFYGCRSATVKDPADHVWILQKDVEGIAFDEMQRRWNTMVNTEHGGVETTKG